VNSLPKTVTRQRRDCDLNLSPSAPESSTLTTRLPSHPSSSLLITVKWSINWFACIQRSTCTSCCTTPPSIEWHAIKPTKIRCHGNVPSGIEKLKANFRSFIYSQSSTSIANLAKFGPVDVEIIGLTEIVKRLHTHTHTRLTALFPGLPG